MPAYFLLAGVASDTLQLTQLTLPTTLPHHGARQPCGHERKALSLRADTVSVDRKRAIAAFYQHVTTKLRAELNDGTLHHAVSLDLSIAEESAAHHPFRCHRRTRRSLRTALTPKVTLGIPRSLDLRAGIRNDSSYSRTTLGLAMSAVGIGVGGAILQFRFPGSHRPKSAHLRTLLAPQLSIATTTGWFASIDGHRLTTVLT